MNKSEIGSGLLLGMAALAAAVFLAEPARAQVGLDEDLFGTSSYVSPGNASPRAVKIEADDSSEFGGVDYPTPVPVAIENVNLLSTDYFFPAGSSCGGGSPRFVLALQGGGHINVYIGPPPNYTLCPDSVWANTGNLLTPASLVDTQNAGGTFYEPWATAQTRLAGRIVEEIFIVTDTFAGPRTTIIDNTNVNGTLYQYEEASFYVDHYTCYDAQEVTRFQQRNVTLDDQFGPPDTMKVRKPTSLCTPVDKNGEGINFAPFHLVCYDVDENDSANVIVEVTNQFGEQKLRVKNRQTLCVPSTKEIISKGPPDHHHGHHWWWWRNRRGH
jgi:hypothetical protein